MERFSQSSGYLNLHLRFFSFVLIFVLTFAPADAGYEWKAPAKVCNAVHNYQPEPYSGVPPPMPELPDQYSMHVQANIIQKKWSTEVVEHYDGPNKRAAVFLTFNGTTIHTIFNFDTMQTYDIYPNGTCNARPSHTSFFGFIKMDKKHRPVMATMKQMFHLDSKEKYTYVGQTWVGGVNVHHWTSCQEWDSGAKYQLDYYFPHQDYQTAWGQTKGQIPVRAVLNGTAGNVNMQQEAVKGSHTYQHIYDFTNLGIGPIRDKSVFEIPSDVVCTGRSDQKRMPELPDNFQMDMEMMCPLMGSSAPLQQTLRYDWEHLLVEKYMEAPFPQGNNWMAVSQKGISGMDGKAMQALWDVDNMVMKAMSMVDDYNTGLRYITERDNNSCRVLQIPKTDDTVPMDHGMSLLKLHHGQKMDESPFSYQGRSTFRGLPVEVWGHDTGGTVQKVFFLTKKQFQKMSHTTHTGIPPTPNRGSSGGQERPGKSEAGDHIPPGRGDHGKQESSSQSSHPGYPGGNSWSPKSAGKDTNGKSSNHNPTTTVKMPFPVMVGMLLRNRTAISNRNLPGLFKEIYSTMALQWAKGVETQDKEHTNLDKFVSMHDMHDTAMRHMGELDTNVFHFQPLHTDQSMFQVSQCYSPEEISHCLLHVQTPFKENVHKDKSIFAIALRKAIAEAMGVSFLQISDLRPKPVVDRAKKVDRTSVTFSLLGSPPIAPSGDFKKQQPSISEAKKKLEQAIKNGISFKVKYATHSKSFMVDKDMYTIDYPMTDGMIYGNTHSSAALGSRSGDNDKSGSSTNGGYSAATMAGIALGTLVLGCVLAVMVLAFIYKRKHPEEMVVPYKMKFSS